MLKKIFALLRIFAPKPIFETEHDKIRNEMELKKAKVRMMIEGRLL